MAVVKCTSFISQIKWRMSLTYVLKKCILVMGGLWGCPRIVCNGSVEPTGFDMELREQ